MSNQQHSFLPKTTTIKIQESRNAHGFKDGERLHPIELERIEKKLKKQLQQIRERGMRDSKLGGKASGKYYVEHQYNSIGIFGSRGSGKSSLLFSLLDMFCEKEYSDVVVLPVIDPTMIEDKCNPFLVVVALIDKAVKDFCSAEELKPYSEAYNRRRDWDICLKNIALGLSSLDKVGKDYKTDNWCDEDYIEKRGMEYMMAAVNLEMNFHLFVDKALEIIGGEKGKKSAFLLAFDDIDSNSQKAWEVLEVLRKYITSPNILCLVAANYDLFGNAVKVQLSHQCGDMSRLCPDEKAFGRMISEHGEQYLEKVIKTDNRYFLKSPWGLTASGDISVRIQTHSSETQSVEKKIEGLLEGLGIVGRPEKQMFSTVLLSLPVRSLLQFIEVNTSKEQHGIERLGEFSAYLAENGIDITTDAQSPNMTSILIAEYLNHKDFASPYVLLLPSSTDPSANKCMVGLNVLFEYQAQKHPYVLLDYMLIVGFVKGISEVFVNTAENVTFSNYKEKNLPPALKIVFDISVSFIEVKGEWDKALLEHMKAIGQICDKEQPRYVSCLFSFVLLAALSGRLRETNNPAFYRNLTFCVLKLVRKYIADKEPEGNRDEVNTELMLWINKYIKAGGIKVAPYILERMVSRYLSSIKAEVIIDVESSVKKLLDTVKEVEEWEFKSAKHMAKPRLSFYDWLSSCPFFKLLHIVS